MNISWGKYNSYLSEITQSLVLKFSLLSKDNEQCHQLVKCRDFIHDVIRCSLTNKTMDLYGLIYKEESPRVDTDSLKIVVELASENSDYSDVQSMLNMLHFYEFVGDFDFYSTAEKVDNPIGKKPCYAFTGPKNWFMSPALISLYTLLIKLGNYRFDTSTPEKLEEQYKKIVAKTKSNESTYLKAIHKHLYNIMKYSKNLFAVNEEEMSLAFFDDIQLSTFHNRYGIVGLINGYYDKKYFNLENFLKGEYKLMEEKTKTKNKITITIANDIKKYVISDIKSAVLYQKRAPLFGFVHKSLDDNRYLCTCLSSCRDYLNNMLFARVNNQEYSKNSKEYPIDMDHLRLCVGMPGKDGKKKLFYVKKILNIIEKYLKFSSTTKISSVVVKDNDSEVQFFLFTGPKDWLKYSHILSLATLLIKGVAYVDGTNFPTIENITDVYTKLFQYINSGEYSSYTKNMEVCLPILLDNFNEIFSEDIETAYDKKIDSNMHSGGGINSLVTSYTYLAGSDNFKLTVRKLFDTTKKGAN